MTAEPTTMGVVLVYGGAQRPLEPDPAQEQPPAPARPMPVGWRHRPEYRRRHRQACIDAARRTTC